MGDKDKLLDLIKRLVQVLDSVVRARDVLLPERARDSLNSAWDELQGTIDDIYRAIRDADEDQLAAAGLAGAQLELKYREFRVAHLRFIRRGGLRRLRDVLGWANVALPSLTAVIKISEPLKELKDAIEKVLEKA